jgi:hypothetical protein
MGGGLSLTPTATEEARKPISQGEEDGHSSKEKLGGNFEAD